MSFASSKSIGFNLIFKYNTLNANLLAFKEYTAYELTYSVIFPKNSYINKCSIDTIRFASEQNPTLISETHNSIGILYQPV